MGKFKRPFLTHKMTQSHQIFTFAKQTGVLVDYQVLSRSLYNWGKYCALYFEKLKKIGVSVSTPIYRTGDARMAD